ncbi:hypothetical protein [Sphingobium xenophagum]|uniref:hypothetical protein n=1 Tax=Sphingobium xenophagum TaxID=121428 RepID=UPI001C0DF3FC|nr:hypothetical protein [Sphingobium xenophagum]QWT15476.1 hypothetical protein GTV57_07010 [Sphingobium xenophagum]
MSLNKQNPGGQAGASRNQLGGWLLPSITASDRQAQMPVSVLRLIEHTFPDHRQAALALLCNDKFGSRVTTNEMAGFHGSKRKR